MTPPAAAGADPHLRRLPARLSPPFLLHKTLAPNEARAHCRDERGASTTSRLSRGSARDLLAPRAWAPSHPGDSHDPLQSPGTAGLPGPPGQASTAKGTDAAELDGPQADGTPHIPRGRGRDNCSSVSVRWSCFSKHRGTGLRRGRDQAGDQAAPWASAAHVPASASSQHGCEHSAEG